MKTSELAGSMLDYWVARAEGWELDPYRPPKEMQLRKPFRDSDVRENRFMGISDGADRLCIAGGGEYIPERCRFRPSTDWVQGGSIIDRERMNFATTGTGPAGENGKAPIVAIPEGGPKAMEGPTHLIAAMRAYVASRFGDTVPDDI